jgi:hypothetical protein
MNMTVSRPIIIKKNPAKKILSRGNSPGIENRVDDRQAEKIHSEIVPRPRYLVVIDREYGRGYRQLVDGVGPIIDHPAADDFLVPLRDGLRFPFLRQNTTPNADFLFFILILMRPKIKVFFGCLRAKNGIFLPPERLLYDMTEPWI